MLSHLISLTTLRPAQLIKSDWLSSHPPPLSGHPLYLSSSLWPPSVSLLSFLVTFCSSFPLPFLLSLHLFPCPLFSFLSLPSPPFSSPPSPLLISPLLLLLPSPPFSSPPSPLLPSVLPLCQIECRYG